MANKQGSSTKHIQIDKANTTVVLLVGFAAFISVFSLVSAKALLSQRDYQNRVIKQKTIARDQLEQNIKAVQPLTESYKKFVSDQANVIGGVASGSGELDGDNAKIVLDALPSKYDFPAVVSSLDKLLKSNSFQLENITGIDDEINQQAATVNGIIEIPFQISVNGRYDGVKEAIVLLERSIRPFQIDELTFTADEKSDIKLVIKGKTFYQPEKSLKITTKEVK